MGQSCGTKSWQEYSSNVRKCKVPSSSSSSSSSSASSFLEPATTAAKAAFTATLQEKYIMPLTAQQEVLCLSLSPFQFWFEVVVIGRSLQKNDDERIPYHDLHRLVGKPRLQSRGTWQERPERRRAATRQSSSRR